ncbi:MAG: hypothetical protein ACI8RD_002332 [Bacillariaceae sp.]|jgi:hypothetical protein
MYCITRKIDHDSKQFELIVCCDVTICMQLQYHQQSNQSYAVSLK